MREEIITPNKNDSVSEYFKISSFDLGKRLLSIDILNDKDGRRSSQQSSNILLEICLICLET